MSAALDVDPDCKHVTAYVCDQCDDIHILQYDADHQSLIGRIDLDRDSLNAFIVELMKLRAAIEEKTE